MFVTAASRRRSIRRTRRSRSIPVRTRGRGCSRPESSPRRATRRRGRADTGSDQARSEEPGVLPVPRHAVREAGRLREGAQETFKQLIALDRRSFLGYYYAGRVMVAAKNYPRPKATIRRRSTQSAIRTGVARPRGPARVAGSAEGRDRATIRRSCKIDPNNDRSAQAPGGTVRRRQERRCGGGRVNAASRNNRDQSRGYPDQDRLAVLRARRFRSRRDRVQLGARRRAEQLPRALLSRHGLQRSSTRTTRRSASSRRFPKITNITSKLACSSPTLYDKESDYDSAIAASKQALAKKPNDAEIMGFLVGVYQEKKDYPERDRAGQEMVALEPQATTSTTSRWARFTTRTSRSNAGVERDAQGDRDQSE